MSVANRVESDSAQWCWASSVGQTCESQVMAKGGLAVRKVHYSSGGDTAAAITFLIVSFVFAEYVIRVCKDFHF